MNETLLDSDKTENAPKQGKFKSRVPSDLMIVLGMLHVLFGLFLVYSYYSVVSSWMELVADSEGQVSTLILLRIMLYNSVVLVYGITLIIGGVGLVRHRMFGWIFALAVSVFGVLWPGLMILLWMIIPNQAGSVSDFIVILFLVFFGLSLAFLLSKTIRNFFQPTQKSFAKAGIVLTVLLFVFLALRFLTHF